MRLTNVENRENRSPQRAYTLPEVMMGVLIMSIMFVTLYLGFTQGFGVVQTSRENLRATQILQQYSELIRLYTWDQLTNSNFIPPTKTWTFYPLGATGSQGVTYTGTVAKASSDIHEEYGTNMQSVTVTLTWTSGNILHTRTMKTMVSQYGLHKYYVPDGP
jgi:prepilin-type N-terminal cleavage/methylation domain-containing protein